MKQLVSPETDCRSTAVYVAIKIANLDKGDNQHSPICGTTKISVANLLNVGKRPVERARIVNTKGAEELQHAIKKKY